MIIVYIMPRYPTSLKGKLRYFNKKIDTLDRYLKQVKKNSKDSLLSDDFREELKNQIPKLEKRLKAFKLIRAKLQKQQMLLEARKNKKNRIRRRSMGGQKLSKKSKLSKKKN